MPYKEQLGDLKSVMVNWVQCIIFLFLQSVYEQYFFEYKKLNKNILVKFIWDGGEKWVVSMLAEKNGKPELYIDRKQSQALRTTHYFFPSLIYSILRCKL